MVVFNIRRNTLLKTIGFLILLILLAKLWTNYCPLYSILASESELAESEALCIVTKQVQMHRNHRNTAHLDPAKIVVDELLGIIVNLPQICHKGNSSSSKNDDKVLIVLIESSRSNFYERQIIRETWGSLKTHNSWHVRLVFLLGQSSECLSPRSMCPNVKSSLAQEETTLLEEHHLYKDTVIGSFADTYKNLTYKTLLGFNYILQECPQADLIIKTDDDMFINLPHLLDLRDTDLSTSANLGVKAPDIYCPYIPDAHPIRCSRCEYGKYRVTRDEWPDENYPPYCIGGAYAISSEWIDKLYSVRGQGGFFKFEDVFITGTLRQIAEKTYGIRTNIVDISENVSVMGAKHLFPEDCIKGADVHPNEGRFGIFVYLRGPRDANDFDSNMKCLWERSRQD